MEVNLTSGAYTIEFYPKWASTDVKDYGVLIQAPISVTIYDSAKKTSNLSKHDFSSKTLKPTVAQYKPPVNPLPVIT